MQFMRRQTARRLVCHTRQSEKRNLVNECILLVFMIHLNNVCKYFPIFFCASVVFAAHRFIPCRCFWRWVEFHEIWSSHIALTECQTHIVWRHKTTNKNEKEKNENVYKENAWAEHLEMHSALHTHRHTQTLEIQMDEPYDAIWRMGCTTRSLVVCTMCVPCLQSQM